MAQYINQAFANDSVAIDGHSFTDCCFKNCRLVFVGNALFTFDTCDFHDCQWVLAGAAERTVVAMRNLAAAIPAARRDLHVLLGFEAA